MDARCTVSLLNFLFSGESSACIGNLWHSIFMIKLPLPKLKMPLKLKFSEGAVESEAIIKEKCNLWNENLFFIHRSGSIFFHHYNKVGSKQLPCYTFFYLQCDFHISSVTRWPCLQHLCADDLKTQLFMTIICDLVFNCIVNP